MRLSLGLRLNQIGSWPQSAVAIPTDFIARYEASDIVGASLIDQSVNGYDGTISGATQVNGEVLLFDGVDDYVDINQLFLALSTTTAGTIAMQFTVPPGGRAYVGFGDNLGNGFIQLAIEEEFIYFGYKLTDALAGVDNFSVRHTAVAVLPNVFYNLVMVSDAVTGVKFFLEGAGELALDTTTGTPGDKWFANNISLNNGRLQSLDYSSQLFYDNNLVSATFYDRIVNSEEINSLLAQRHPTLLYSTLFGDSITVGVGATSYASSWAGLWGADFSTTNTAVNGDQAGDMSYEIQSNHVEESERTYTMMIGTNDHRTYKDDIVKQGFFKSFLRQSLAWMALPTRTNARSVNVVETGIWADTGANAIGRVTTELGATATCSVTGTGVYIGYIIQNSLSSEGVADVRIDGILVGTISIYGQMDTVNGRTFAPAAAYFGGLTDTSHTVEITVTSSGENFYLDYVAGSPQPPPKLIVSNIIKMSDAAYATYGTSEANVIAYNTIISDVISEFASDGVAITAVDNYIDIDPLTDLSDGVHPNDTGHAIIHGNFAEGLL